MKAVLVSRGDVESVRKHLLDAGHLDSKRKITNKGEHFAIPVVDEALPELGSFTIISQEHIEYYEPTPSLKNLMREYLDDKKLDQLPRGWQVLGDIIILSLRDNLYPLRKVIGEVLLQMYPRCKSVFLDKGIEGKLRSPKRELIAVREGVDDPGITINIENGCKFMLDVTGIMFSKGNLNERIRMSRLGGGEVVVDMFAGIGYFTVPIAVHSGPEKIIAIELNPGSYDYLLENIKLNNVQDIVAPVLGDCAEKAPVSAADRVIMGYVGQTSRYLEYGIRTLRRGGILHYHDILPAQSIPHMLEDLIGSEAGLQGRKAEILYCRRIKKYSPGIWHVVVDARIT